MLSEEQLMKMRNIKIVILHILLISVLGASLLSCPKPPINPWDDEGLDLGLVTTAPEFETAGGVFHKDVQVDISCEDEAADIYYTTDGSDPDTSSSRFDGAITLSGNNTNTVIKAIAVNPDKASSHVEAESYRIEYLGLMLSSDGNGIVTPEGLSAVQQDGSIEITAAADSGYAFSNWSLTSGSGVEINDVYSESTSVTLTLEDGEVQAVFAPGTSLTLSDVGNGSTSPAGAVLVVENIPRTVQAFANTGYVFRQWTVISGSGVVIDDVYSSQTRITLTGGAAALRADFEPLKYNLNITSSSGGSTSPAGIIEVQHDVAQAITATVSSGWVFSHWSIESGSGVSIDDSSAASTNVTCIDGAAEIKANYVIERSLTITDDGNGLTVPAAGLLAIGDGMPLAIVASPDTGYGFSHWSTTGAASVGSTNNASTTVILSGGNGTVTAHFTDNTYELTVQSDSNGSVTPSGAVQVVHGVAESISATAVTTGYEFGSWTVPSGSASIASSSAANTTVTLTSGAATVQANFVLKAYYLTMSDNGFGSTSSSRNATHGVDYGITATADFGYEFDSWNVTSGSAIIADSAAASTTVRLESGNATVEAVFTPLDYPLTISTDGNGTVDPTGLQTVSHAASTAITASPSQYYEFSHWSVENGTGVSFDDENSASTNVTLSNGSADIQANFILVSYDLTINDNGYGSTTTSTSVSHGIGLAISATADPGYEFSDWEVTTGTADFANPSSADTTVTLTSGNATIRANFTPLDYTLTIQSGINGSVGSSGDQTVSHAASTLISATPDTNYVFAGWTVETGTGVSFDDATSATANVTLTGGDATILANFIIESFDLTITNDGGGTTTESLSVSYGASNTITAVPNTGYNFVSWEVTSGTASITDTGATETDIILYDGPATIIANFALKQYTLTITDNGHGTTSQTGDLTVQHGVNTGWITATPDVNYDMSRWIVTDDSSGDTIYSVANINMNIALTDGDATATAEFIPEPPVVSIEEYTNDSTPTISWSSPVAAEYDFYIWGEDNPAITSAATSHTWSTLSDGVYTFYIRCRDIDGNENYYSSYTMRVDTVKPDTPVLTQIAGPAGEHDTTPWIFVSNNTSSANMYRFSYTDGSGWIEQSGPNYNESSELSFGSHTIYAQMRDYAGNWSDSGSLTFNVTLGIGSECHGGVVFYLDGTGGGMVAAPSDQSTGIYWWPNTTNADHSIASGTSIGMGMNNTVNVGTGQPTVATGLCLYLDLNGYTDWFLPSRDELVLMMDNLSHSVYGFENNEAYWSSSADAALPVSRAISVSKPNFDPAVYQSTTKNYTGGNIRAAREF
jgi:hypothetical protein